MTPNKTVLCVFCRRLCRRGNRFAVCLHLLPSALPAVPSHGLPPALRQSGCCGQQTFESRRGLAAHRQRHQSSFGGFDRRASMTSGHHRDFAPDYHQTPQPTSTVPVTASTVDSNSSIPLLIAQSRWHPSSCVFIVVSLYLRSVSDSAAIYN